MILILMDQEEWRNFYRQGLIPGPLEDQQSFEERARFCLNIKEMIDKSLLPSDRLDATDEMLDEGVLLVRKEFGIAPEWVPLFFSNQGLMPWHGGSALIFQLKEGGPLGALIQLRKSFYCRKSYLGLYDRSEMIAHELVHAARMAFNEPRYEELLAYQTSSKGISRHLGPIIQSACESRLFVYLLATLLILDLYLALTGEWEGYFSLMPLKIIPLMLCGFAFLRLKKKQNRLKSAEQNLQALYGKEKARHILIFLADQEIELIARMNPSEILSYFQEGNSCRMQMLRFLTIIH